MSRNVKGKISSRSDIMSREEIEADLDRHSKKVPHSQIAMSRGYEQRHMYSREDKIEINENHPFRRTPKVTHNEFDTMIRKYARKDPHLAYRIQHEDTMRNLYENRIRKEGWKDKLGIFISIALTVPFFLNINKGQISTTTDMLFAMVLTGIILFGPLRKKDTAIKGVILTFLVFFITFISSYWETGHTIASDKGMKPDSFLHLLTVTPLKYILISVLVGAILIFYERISSSVSSLYHVKR